MSRKISLVLAMMFALFFSTPSLAQAPPAKVDIVREADATLHHDWFGVYSQGKKVGFMRDAAEKVTENGQTTYRTRTQLQIKVVALGEKGVLKHEQVLEFAGKAPFALLRGELLSDDGNSTRRITLVAK